jgi:hypothetical protein
VVPPAFATRPGRLAAATLLQPLPVTVPAGGGGVFDVKITTPGFYPFVVACLGAVDQGQVGLLNVGNVKGAMSH